MNFQDLWDLQEQDSSKFNSENYEKNFKKSKNTVKSLWETYKKQFLLSIFFRVITEFLVLFQPYCLKLLIAENSEKLLISLVLFLTSQMHTIINHQHWAILYRLMMYVKAVVGGAVYKKSLKLSSAARKEYDSGKLMNLMSNDVEKLVIVTSAVTNCVAAMIQTLFATFFLGHLFGIAILPALFLVFLLWPIKKFMINSRQIYENKVHENRNERAKLELEVLNGIKMLKLYSWERNMEKKVLEVRKEGLEYLRKIQVLDAIYEILWNCFPFLVTSLTLITFVSLDLEHNILTPELIFVSLSYFGMLRRINQLSSFYNYFIECQVVNKRMNTFFGAEEVLAVDYLKPKLDDPGAITIENGQFTWNNDNDPVLRDISLHVKPGQLVAIVGKVGAGKSSLIQAILGEMNRLSGDVEVNGTISYVPQQTWIQNMTLQNNILFDKPFNSEFYDDVIRRCALDEDLSSLPKGDQTEIGEKGINLSGGQKQRISLARSVYQKTDIVLLDDPLSAVDARVGKHIFENAISSETGCLAGKTRILVTHSLTYLKHCDHVIVMENGRISEQGTYQELLDNDVEFLEERSVKEVSEEKVDKDQPSFAAPIASPRKPFEKEEPQKGEHSSQEIFQIYLQAVGLPIIFLYILARGIIYFMGAYNSFILANVSDNPMSELKLYAILGAGQSIPLFLATWIITFGTLKAGRTLYSKLLQNILQSPMIFFDITPFGSITTRLGNDINVIDTVLPSRLSNWILHLIGLTFTIITLIWTTPWTALVFFGLARAYLQIMKYFVGTNRQLKRLDSDSNAPIHSYFQESIQGASSIRAFRVSDRFINRLHGLFDNHLMANHLSVTANRWLGVRLETIGNIVVLFVAIAAVYTQKSAGIIGFAITTALTITEDLTWVVRMMSEMESTIISVERINEFSNTPIEGHPANVKVSKNWPEHGRISINNLQVRYRAGLDLVLHGLTFQIEPKKKIGIVGRTGAGKSSITMALFRMIESDQGSIEIDGINIAHLDLEVLRSRLTIVPQDPVCFSGSFKMNLDPFKEYSNSEIWEALRNVNLASFVETLPGGLDYQIIEGGDNLSIGQRQLICLARALLRKSRILVLDEAAAAVDLETESLIQKTTREKFKDSTVLTIAHRLNTVMENDRILVLDKGHVAEFDTPKNLLENPNGVFYSMARDANIL